ncbi:MAG: putative zinc-binding protein [Anaerolineae bacterium]
MAAQTGVPLPNVGIFACFSGGSNTGSLAGMAALEVVRRLGSDQVGICSLPATLNEVPRQSALVKKIKKIVVVDGCHNACARQLLAGMGINPDVYLNLEQDLGIEKKGPFSSLGFTDSDVRAVADSLTALVQAASQAGLP